MDFRPAVLIRVSVVALFLWFGSQQVADPSSWVGFLPEWTGYFPIPGEMLVRLNGWFEIVAALMLAIGVQTRIVAFLLGAHLAAIAVTVGGPIAVRDGTLALITLALAWSKPDAITLDAREAAAKNAAAAPASKS